MKTKTFFVLALVAVGLLSAVLILDLMNKAPEPVFLQTGAIKKFTSQAELNAFIKYYSEQGGNYYGGYARDGIMFSMSKGISGLAEQSANAPPSVPSANAPSGAGDFSSTNVQVEGVDEADIVKNDGKYLYIVSGNKVVIVDAYPAENAEILSEIDFNVNPLDIFVNKDKLIVFIQEYPQYNENEPMYKVASYRPYYPDPVKTAIKIYDISDRKNPKLWSNLTAEGNYFDSRMIGDYVYVIVNEPIYYYPCRGVFGCAEPEIKLPETSANGKKITPEVSEIYYFDIPDYSYRFTTVLAVNVNDESRKFNSKNFVMGNTQNMFVSLDNIYVTQTSYSNYREYRSVYEEVVIPVMPDDDRSMIKEIEDSNKTFFEKRFEEFKIVSDYMINMSPEEQNKLYNEIQNKINKLEENISKNREKTVINKISIIEGKIEPKATGEVSGTVLNQFSMDEYKGYFRIATTTGQVSRTGSESSNNVYVLNENLETVGVLEDLAKGEKIYSARFMGDRCYMVTFRKVDPLFVIDLSDAKNPEVLGQLKIPGYSDYLHPYDENHLIGIGKGAVAAEEGDFAWYQGVKISLFDVSDVEKPKEISKYEIGDRGTDSYALQDHKAFLFSKTKNLLVVPVLLAEIDEEKYPLGVEPNTYGDYVWQGAYVFSVDTSNGFQLKGRVTHEDADVFKKTGYYYYSPYSVKRSLYMDDTLYTISDIKVKMNDLNNLDEIKELEINSAEVQQGYPVE